MFLRQPFPKDDESIRGYFFRIAADNSYRLTDWVYEQLNLHEYRQNTKMIMLIDEASLTGSASSLNLNIDTIRSIEKYGISLCQVAAPFTRANIHLNVGIARMRIDIRIFQRDSVNVVQ